MGRNAFMRNHLLWISVLITAVGLLLTIFSFGVDYLGANWTDPYEDLVPGGPGESNWNLWVRVVAPIVLLTGLWYLGEQILARRKFHKLIATEKKSDFQKAISTLETKVKILPKKLEAELTAKEASFKSKR